MTIALSDTRQFLEGRTNFHTVPDEWLIIDYGCIMIRSIFYAACSMNKTRIFKL
jgi:hypothetical protein